MTQNDAQIEYWNGAVGERWARLNAILDRSLARISDAALAFAEARAGERVLDIGCGCGTTSFALAKAGAHVTGVDISRPMLDVARARGAGAGFIEADASAHRFAPEYDLVFSRFGVMFFGDPAAAFANIRTALKQGGRLAFVCWRAAKENPWASAPMAAAKHLLPEQPQADPHAPGPFAFADGARLADILAAAGYRDIQVERLDCVMWMGSDAQEAAAQTLNIGPLARAAAELDDSVRENIRAAVEGAISPYNTEDGIAPPASCWLVAARA